MRAEFLFLGTIHSKLIPAFQAFPLLVRLTINLSQITVPPLHSAGVRTELLFLTALGLLHFLTAALAVVFIIGFRLDYVLSPAKTLYGIHRDAQFIGYFDISISFFPKVHDLVLL